MNNSADESADIIIAEQLGQIQSYHQMGLDALAYGEYMTARLFIKKAAEILSETRRVLTYMPSLERRPTSHRDGAATRHPPYQAAASSLSMKTTPPEDASAMLHVHRAEMLLSNDFCASAAEEFRRADLPRIAAIVAETRD